MSAAVLVALALLEQSDPYSARLHALHSVARMDSDIANAARIEADLRARVRFEADPNTAAIRIVILGDRRRISIDVFRRNAVSWIVERIEMDATASGYDRATPIATRYDLPPTDVAALRVLLGSVDMSVDADCAERSVISVHDNGDEKYLVGCPVGAAGKIMRILDAGGPKGAH